MFLWWNKKFLIMKKVLFLFLPVLVFLQLTILPSIFSWWKFDLAFGFLLVLVLAGFSLGNLLWLAFLAGLFFDFSSGHFFGLNLFLWPLVIILVFWFSQEKFSIERNFISSLVFIFFGFLFLEVSRFLLAALLSVGFSWSALPFLNLSFWMVMLVNIAMALLVFFLLNFLKIKNKLNA